MAKKFLSGNEAFAEGIRLAKPQVISAYPITPQTIVVEKLSEMVEDGSLKSEFIHVESEQNLRKTTFAVKIDWGQLRGTATQPPAGRMHGPSPQRSPGAMPPGSGLRNYFALGPASAMFLGMLGYFLAKFSENIFARLLAAAT